MDRGIIIGIVLGVLAVASVGSYLAWRRRLRAKRLMKELLEGYFEGDMSAEQLARRVRETGNYRFTGSAEFYSLAIAAFQSAAEAKLARQPHSLEDENKLLRSLAALKQEFGLPDRYRIEAWRAGRE